MLWLWAVQKKIFNQSRGSCSTAKNTWFETTFPVGKHYLMQMKVNKDTQMKYVCIYVNYCKRFVCCFSVERDLMVAIHRKGGGGSTIQ